MADLIGQRLGQYEILSTLGRGGMATVYRARQLNIDREVAVKVIEPDLAGREDFIKRFRREAQTIANLSHPHILKMFDYGQADNLVFLVMELLPGGNLSDLIKQGALPPETAGRILEQIASALDYAHQHGIIHRDLKPQNVLLDDNGNVFLSDFGIAKVVRDVSTLTQDGSVLGTPYYMSPEQWRGEPVDPHRHLFARHYPLPDVDREVAVYQRHALHPDAHAHLRETALAAHDAAVAVRQLRRGNRQGAGERSGTASGVRFTVGRGVQSGTGRRTTASGGDGGSQLPAKSARGTSPFTQPAQNAAPPTPDKAVPPAQPAQSAPARPATAPLPRKPSGPPPSLYSVFDYLASLVAERDEDEPFLLSQLQPALRYKFPDFSLADYKMAGVKDFIQAGEKAEYFKLVNTGSAQTSYLAPGPKAAAPEPEPEEAIDASDPRRLRWMTTAMEAMLQAERSDQIMDAIRGVNARAPEFDSFLAAEGKAAHMYATRGKIQRLRDFLKVYREKGEPQAMSTWQTSRMVLRMPSVPEVKSAATAQSLIWSLMQGSTLLEKVPLEAMDNLFFAVLAFSRDQMARNKSWDWVAGLNILEADARAVPRPAPPPPQKRGLFGGGKQPEPPKFQLDENEIKSLADLLRSTAGIDAAQADPTPTYQAFVDTPTPDAGLRFLWERAKLVEDDHLLNWLDDQISLHVAGGSMQAVTNLAQKAALVITARQYGVQQVPKQTAEFQQTAQSVMEGAQLLRVLFGFVDAPTTADAVLQYQQHAEFTDSDNIHMLLDDQTLKVVRHGDVARYRRLTERADLYRNLAEFGPEEGVRQHELFLSGGRDDKTVQAEMGITLLAETSAADERQEIIGKYPPVATREALDMVTRMLDHLSFHNASTEEYNRYFEVKRIIERCLQVGIDRALSELK